MIYECTECDNIIPQGKSWVFGKDYLFCSTDCRDIFLLKNPNIQNITIPNRIPEQTPAYFESPSLPSPIIYKNPINPPCSPPTTILEYTKCNLLSKNYIFTSLRDIFELS